MSRTKRKVIVIVIVIVVAAGTASVDEIKTGRLIQEV
jgi:hypothetical protein